MKTLVLLRALSGTGKSTFIQENNLQAYTISPDAERMRLGGLELNLEGNLTISQSNENAVWKSVNKQLHDKMSKGEFVVVDATNLNNDFLMNYKNLSKDYRYRVFMIDFTETVTFDELLTRNSTRPEYQRVPVEVLYAQKDAMENQNEIGIPAFIEVIKPHEFKEKVLSTNVFDYSHYEKIHHIGDIHGCATALLSYFEEVGFPSDLPNELFIFTGDYFERGLENAHVAKFLMRIMKQPNVILLEGNHELYMFQYANGEEIRCREFRNVTAVEFDNSDINKKDLRVLYRKLRQQVAYQYGNKKVMVTHGGLSTFPYELTKVPLQQVIRGVGDYNTDIDAIFSENVMKLEQELNDGVEHYQVHGHRNLMYVDTISDRSINLEGGVDNGEFLRIAVLSKDGWNDVEIQNTVFNPKYKRKVINEGTTVEEMVDILRHNHLVKERDNGNGISSFNFLPIVFYDGIWNKQTMQARGLHVDVQNNEIVGRSFNKFFNVGEYDITE